MLLNEITVNLDSVEIELPNIPEVKKDQNGDPVCFGLVFYVIDSNSNHFFSPTYNPTDLISIYGIDKSELNSFMKIKRQEFESFVDNVDNFFSDPVFVNYILLHSNPDLDINHITFVRPLFSMEPIDDE